MKKIILFCSFFMLCAGSAYAQKFGGGIILGASVSQIDGDTYSGYHKPGFLGGVIVNRPFTEKFSMAMELKFVQKGTQTRHNDDGSGRYYKVNLNYVQIPVMAQYNFWNNFWGELGLSYGYLISFKEEDDYGEFPDPIAFRKSELGVLLGVAYDIPNTKLRLNIRATNSIIPVRKNDSAKNSYLDPSKKGQYNRDLEFAVMWFFGEKRN